MGDLIAVPGGGRLTRMSRVPLDLDARACRKLWQAVLLENMRNAVGVAMEAERARAQLQARAWMGSAGFHEVCDLACVDADSVLAWYRRAKDSPDGQRHLRQRQRKTRRPHEREGAA